jgi:hypothetical protein
MDLGLEGKVALVTGTGSSIGSAGPLRSRWHVKGAMSSPTISMQWACKKQPQR